MRRLSLTIFLSLLASLILVGAAVVAALQWNLGVRNEARETRFAEVLLEQVLPVAAEGEQRLHKLLQHWHRRLDADVQVVDAQGRVLASAGRPFSPATAPGEQLVPEAPAPRPGRAEAGQRQHHRGDGRRSQRMMAVVHRLALPDQRTLLVRIWRPRPPGPPLSLPQALALLFAAVALAAWPVSRRITRRLEALTATVDRQAGGELGIRAEVQGRDEVAVLAQSFNRAAEQIEKLVGGQAALLDSQRQLLANASHELRSPLARIRMATELLLENPDEAAEHAEELRLNIRELDALVEEILLASRLEGGAQESVRAAPLDLAVLAASEAARIGASLDVVDAGPFGLQGDERLLRRLLRNLLENARRYQPADAGPVQLRLLRPAAGQLRIEVLDRGPGVPETARARIFEPFYRVEGHSEGAGGVGLGLALVRQIACRHGGDAHYQPRPGGGSCFVVGLPGSTG